MSRNARKYRFHESYYDHACLIVSERDVLDIDIRGMNWSASLRRRWHDLFLLSYSDERAGDYYNSTHAMRMNRMIHFRRHRGCIHPLSKFRLVFLRTHFPKIIFYLAMLLELFVILDIYINARTGFKHNVCKKIVLDGYHVLLNYCSTKLFFHSLSAIPLVFIMFLRYGKNINCALCKANYFNCVINFLTIINLFRVYELSSYWKRDRMSYYETMCFHFIRIGVIICLAISQFLHYSDIICLIQVMKTSAVSTPTHNSSFFDALFSFIYVEKVNFTNMMYINAHFWRIMNFLARPSFSLTLKTTNYKYAVIYPHPLMKFTAYTLILISTVWLAFEMFCCITRENYFDDEVYKNEQYLSNLIQAKQLSEDIRAQIKDYFNFIPAKIKLMEQKNSLNLSLPTVLKDEIRWQSFSRYVLRIPYFSDWPKEVIEKLVRLITEQIYLKNDLIAEVGVPADGLMILYAGVLAVYSLQNEEVGHLIDGDYFGELSLVTDREIKTSHVIAVSDCKILVVEKISFRHMMRDYPKLFYSLRLKLKRKYNAWPVARLS
ncbi:potassium/sodium hyperpolarization-activated cyclic nucleotide-gated channel 1-like [Amyelois transitella]|uniref:potassium/sodium hyperpolarization-activated cyclic nucleotide-gated channel 1-like n=1 Tax=Amyelois transitella TaxID=680683 RepID=UPI00298F9E7C|nr:potassium/sodium hyperpolarization-activated cyclic nucleotide-gated channel 1-like [Amyelois transitella]